VVVAAALLVLLGLGLFVGGFLTEETVLYWLCVGACAVAGVFLLLARVRTGRAPAALPGPERTAGAGQRAPSSAGAASSAAAPVPGPPAEPRSAAPAPSGSLPETAVGAHSIPAHAARAASGASSRAGEPPIEDVEVTDLLLVVDLRDEVLVVDEHPRYHLGGCRGLAGRETIPLPLDEARTDGFTPCGWCQPDRTLAERERGRRAGRGA
jgi:hypothetical protein